VTIKNMSVALSNCSLSFRQEKNIVFSSTGSRWNGQ